MSNQNANSSNEVRQIVDDNRTETNEVLGKKDEKFVLDWGDGVSTGDFKGLIPENSKSPETESEDVFNESLAHDKNKMNDEFMTLDVLGIAPIWKRAIAYFIDGVLLTLVASPLFLSYYNQVEQNEVFVVEWKWLVALGCFVFSYQWFFIYLTGATPGKWVMGLRVISLRNSGLSLGLFQSFLRCFADGLSFLLGMIPRAFALLRFDRKSFSDWVADTQVMQLAHRSSGGSGRQWFLFFVVVVYSFYFHIRENYYGLQETKIKFTRNAVILKLNK